MRKSSVLILTNRGLVMTLVLVLRAVFLLHVPSPKCSSSMSEAVNMGIISN